MPQRRCGPQETGQDLTPVEGRNGSDGGLERRYQTGRPLSIGANSVRPAEALPQERDLLLAALQVSI